MRLRLLGLPKKRILSCKGFHAFSIIERLPDDCVHGLSFSEASRDHAAVTVRVVAAVAVDDEDDDYYERESPPINSWGLLKPRPLQHLIEV